MANALQIPDEVNLVEFIAREAHDLKSPFNRILGFIKLVLKGMDGPISDQAREDLNTAYQNSLYALALMSGVVETARFSQGQRELFPEEYALDTLLQRVMVDWKKQCPKERPVELRSAVPPIHLRVDDISARMSLYNWISYVAEFVQEEIVVQISAVEEAGACRIQIRSTGRKTRPAPDCDLTLYGFVAKRSLEVNGGALLVLEEDDLGARVEISIPK